MQAGLNRHIERGRDRIDTKKAAVDANLADRDADMAEADATDAIAFAFVSDRRSRVRDARRDTGT
jgi:hypothetical protein